MTLGGIEIIKRYVEIGLGLALVPEVAVEEEVSAGKVRAIQVNGLAKRRIGLIEHRQRRRSPATEAFLALFARIYCRRGDLTRKVPSPKRIAPLDEFTVVRSG